MVCPRCGSLNADEKEFCRQCGASLHWGDVIGPDTSRDRQAWIGLGAGAVVLAFALVVGFFPPLTLFGASTSSRAPLDTPVPAATALPAATLEPTVPPAPTVSADLLPQVASPTPGFAGPLPPIATPPITPALAPPITATSSFFPPPGVDAGPLGGSERDASIAYVRAVEQPLTQGRDVLMRFTNEWRGPTGDAALLLSGVFTDTKGLTQRAEQARRDLDAQALVVQRQQAPVTLQALQNTLLGAFNTARAAFGKAAEVASGPDPEGVEEVSRLLERAGTEFGTAAEDLDSAKMRLATQ